MPDEIKQTKVRFLKPGTVVHTEMSDGPCLVIKKRGCFPSLVNINSGRVLNESTNWLAHPIPFRIETINLTNSSSMTG